MLFSDNDWTERAQLSLMEYEFVPTEITVNHKSNEASVSVERLKNKQTEKQHRFVLDIT